MKSIALAAVVMLLCPRAGQDEEPSIEEELQELLAAINAHDSLRLLYDGTNEEAGEAHETSLEIVYQGPDRAAFRLEMGDRGAEMLVSGMDAYARELGGDAAWRRARVRESEPLRLFDELLPTQGALEPGVAIGLRGGAGFELSIGWNTLGRRAFLGFFSSMLRDPESVRREETELVWSDGALTLTISRESGVPERIDVAEGDKGLHLQLRAADVGADVVERLEVPEDARASEVDPEFQAFFDELHDRFSARRAGFERLDHQLDAGMRALDADTRERFESFLEVLHEELMDAQWSEWLGSLRTYTDEFVDWAREVREQEVVAPHAEERRMKLVAGFDRALEQYHEALSELASGDLEDELFEIEREVVERLHAELVSGPILAYFDEQLDAVLGD
jgi:hypothetical protein